jgi:Forkhead domain/FHA domain
MAPSPVEELSIPTATAMTSPLASTAVMARADFDHTEVTLDLTAADNADQSANDTPTLDTSQDKIEEAGREMMIAQGERVGSIEAGILQGDSFDTETARLRTLDMMTAAEAVAGFMGWNPQQSVAAYRAALGDQALPAASADSFPFPYPGSPPHLHEQDETRISAYAMLEFDDGQFYMNTYSVILGRDLAAARAAMRRDVEKLRREAEVITEDDNPAHNNGGHSRYTRSIISESAGILREGDDSDSDERARRRRNRRHSKKSKSTGSSSQRISRRNSLALQNGKVDYQSQPQARRYAPDNVRAAPVDPASLRPSPHDCPLVGIHPPAATPASGFKAISRRHVKIAYNSKKNLFEAEIIGRNGAFIDEVFYYHSDVVPLKSGSVLQIGGVVVRFILPEVAIGETGAESHGDYEDGAVTDRYSEGGKEMSFDFEDTPREGAKLEETSEEESEDEDEGEVEDEDDGDLEEIGEEVVDNSERSGDMDDGEGDDDNGEGDGGDEAEEGEDEDEEEEEEEGGEEEEEEEVREPSPKPQKRRGPGRPPKNGIMSKREQQLAKREAQQKAKKTVPQPQPPVKNKVGRPRKYPQPETPPIKIEKRKYTKRKPRDPDVLVKQDGSADDDGATREKREKRAAKPPRSPTPTFREEDLTPEQLAKPNVNYVTLIHEALSNSPSGMMSLPQIYRAIQRKYPYFVVRCPTTGWQSSVRHNLSQHHAFRKVERDGKGWMWAIVEGVSIEKEKKRRPTPPPHQIPPGHLHQPIYRAGPPPQHITQGPPGMMGPPPGYPVDGNLPPNLGPGQPHQYGPQLMNGYFPPGPHFPVNGQNPLNFPGQMPLAPPVGAHGIMYSSPYAPKPNLDTTLPQNSTVSPSQGAQGPGLSPQTTQQQPPPGLQQSPQLNESISRAIETFKTALIAQLSGKSSNAEAVVASAINRVLGTANQSSAPGDPQEEKIMTALRGMLMKIPGANLPNLPNQKLLPQQPHQPQLPPTTPYQPTLTQALPNPGPSSAAKLAIPPTPISRPSFAGQNQSRTSGAPLSVPRPPMLTPKLAHTNSGSPANAPTRPGGVTSPVSPATIPGAPNGLNVQKSQINDNGKRQLEDSEDPSEREFKRLSAGGPPPLKA